MKSLLIQYSDKNKRQKGLMNERNQRTRVL